MKRCNKRQPANELRYQTEFHKVIRLDKRQERVGGLLLLAPNFGPETHGVLVYAPSDDLFKAIEGTATNEEDIPSVNVDKALLRVFASAFRRDACECAFQNLQQCLLHTFTRDVTGD